MWGRVGAGNLGVSLQTQPSSSGWGEKQCGISQWAHCVWFRTPRNRDAKPPDSTKHNKTYVQKTKRKGEHWCREILIVTALKKALK